MPSPLRLIFFLARQLIWKMEAKTFNMQNVIFIQYFRANKWKKKKRRRVCMHAQLHSCVQLFATPWTVTHQTSLSVGFPRQEYWGGLPFPTPEDLPDPGIETVSCIDRWILYRGATWEAKEEWGAPYLLRGSRLEAAIHRCVACLIQVGLLWALPWKFKYWLKLQSMYRWGDPDSSLRTLETNMKKMWFRDWERLEIVRSWLTS